MAISSWPYVDQDTTDIEYGRLFREMAGYDGVVGSAGDSSLLTYGDSSGRRVKISPGAAILRGYMFHNTGYEFVPISVASGSTRIDLIVLELNLSEPTIALRIRPRAIDGVPGAGMPPGLTQTETDVYQIPLAAVTVAPGATTIAASNVSDYRSWMHQQYGTWSTGARPSNPRRSKLGYNTTLNVWEYWSGSSWEPLNAVNLAGGLVTGTLPISKGGTGATSWQAARNNLGIFVQDTAPPYAEGRVWIKVP